MKFESAKLDYIRLKEEGGATYGVTDFRVTWTINAIPVADVTLALGVLVGQKTVTKFLTSRDRLTGRYYLEASVNGEELELFGGYISGVTQVKNNNAMSGQMRIRVTLVGLAAALQGMAIQGYKYFSTKDDLVGFTSGAAGNPVVSTPEELYGRILGETSLEQAVSIPEVLVESSVFLQNVTESGATGEQSWSEHLIREIIIPDDVSLRAIVVQNDMGPKLIFEQIYNLYWKSYQNTNAWQALVATANFFFLAVVPRDTGHLITPAFFWKKEPEWVLGPSEVLSVQRNDNTSVYYDGIDGVAVALPVPTSSTPALNQGYVTYPTSDKMTVASGRVRVVNTLPPWLCGAILVSSTGEIVGEGEKSDEGADQALKKPEATPSDTDGKDLGDIYAKLAFASASGASTTMQLEVRWDIILDFINMVGYLIKVEKLGKDNTEGPQEFYGALTSVTFSGRCSATESANLSLVLGLSHVRSKEINDEYALAENPIYQSGS
jgi:hypothetical protein